MIVGSQRTRGPVVTGIVAVLVFAYTWIGRRYLRQDA